MYYANKIVGWVLSPIGILFLGLAAGFLLCALKKACAFSKAITLLALVFFWLLGCGITTRFIGTPLEGEESTLSCEDYPQADAIVLLGGGMGVHPKCGRAEIYAGADRVWMASKLFKAGKAPIMTVSGGGALGELIFLADMGVDTNRVIVLDAARNTEEEARFIRAKLTAPKPKILLVTSAWHMPRARMLFERAGLEIVPAPTDYEMTAAAEGPIKIGDFFPNAEALLRNSYTAKEWVARVLYALKGK